MREQVTQNKPVAKPKPKCPGCEQSITYKDRCAYCGAPAAKQADGVSR